MFYLYNNTNYEYSIVNAAVSVIRSVPYKVLYSWDRESISFSASICTTCSYFNSGHLAVSRVPALSGITWCCCRYQDVCP